MKHETSLALSRMKERGLQAWLARKSGYSRTTVTMIFRGIRQCTAKQAAVLEDLFTRKNIPLNRWDLLYGYEASKTEPKTLEDYLREKLARED